MRIYRAVCTALIAISVALLPIPGLLAHAPAAEPSLHVVDCCHAEAPCKKGTRGCDASTACAQKCSSVSGTIVQRLALATWTSEAKASLPRNEIFHSSTSAPPLPPPRT
jgi:hypothetical protein